MHNASKINDSNPDGTNLTMKIEKKKKGIIFIYVKYSTESENSLLT